jgi:hypothetical protein
LAVGGHADDYRVSKDAAPQAIWDGTASLKIGDVLPARSHVSSLIEETVRAHFVKMGYAMSEEKVAVLCRHPDPKHKYLTLTPDIVLVDHKIAVEVDPCGRCDSARGYTHRGEEEKDQIRNDAEPLNIVARAGATPQLLRHDRGQHQELRPRVKGGACSIA